MSAALCCWDVGSAMASPPKNSYQKFALRYALSLPAGTMSWQAPDFYKKYGYRIIGELENIPEGNKKYHLVKDL